MEVLTCPEDNDCRGIVIDDDIDALDSLSELLELNGISVIGKGTNGEEAYQLYKLCHPKFVILDMKMPKYDGAYAIKKIKNDDPNAKIIVLSGYTDFKIDQDEVTAVMLKPYDVKKVINLIEGIC